MSKYNISAYNGFTYGGSLAYIPPVIEPDDAQSIIADLYPERVNWVGDPGFQNAIDTVGTTSWKSINLSSFDTSALFDSSAIYDSVQIYDGTITPSGGATRITVTTSPYCSHAVTLAPSRAIVFGDFADLAYAIPVSPPEGEDKEWVHYQQNLWKFSYSVRKNVAEGTTQAAPTGMTGGFLVQNYDGSYRYVMATLPPKPLPWDASITDPTTSTNGWYTIYQVLDLGPTAQWAVPILSNTHATDTTVFTSVIAERWDTVDLLSGGVFLDVGQDQSPAGDARAASFPEPWEYDWSRANLVELDPLVFFDGDSSVSTQDDFVWITPSNGAGTVSGYYPQRRQRTDGLRLMLRSWLPATQTFSLRYTMSRPRVLRP